MSRRDRRNKRSESPARPDTPPRDPGLPTVKGTILLTALALVASAVFFYQITRPTSFLSAIMQVEYSRLLPPEKGKLRADGGPTWETVYQQYQERLRKEPVTQRHFAVSDLLDAVVEVERGKRPAAEMVGKMQSRFAVDQDNAISRLAYATLVDAGAAGKPATERFDEWRRIVEQPSPAKVSALYNKEYDEVFANVLSGYIKRADVRANLVKYMDHFVITDHYAALPMIQARLAKLADELSAAGKTTEAETCRRWVVRACLGLMEYEWDAGTRLLCADLAARCLPAGEPLKASLTRLRADYHLSMAAPVVDLASLGRSFVTNPGAYREMMRYFFFSCAWAMVALGAATMLILSLLTALFRTSASGHHPDESDSNVLVALKMVFAAVVVGVSAHIRVLDVFSESSAMVWVVCVFAIGALVPDLISSVARNNRRGENWVSTIRWPLIGLVVLYCILPAEKTAGAIRWLDLRGGAIMYVLAVLLPLLVLTLLQRRTAHVRVVQAAATTWLCFMILANAGVLIGWGTGISTIDDLARSRMDEFAYVLPGNWASEYRIPAASAYDHSTIKTTP